MIGHIAAIATTLLLPFSCTVSADTPATRVSTPIVVPVIQNTSSCKRTLQDEVFRIAIPSINYDCPVYLGDQPSIDRGLVTLMDRNTVLKSFDAITDDYGVLWIAAHRNSAGGPFSQVPNLFDGSEVFIYNENFTHRYVVVDRTYVQTDSNGFVNGNEADTNQAILRNPDWSAHLPPSLTLQTCDGSSRWMIYADKVTQ